jgi:hypothetical protein
MKNLIYLLIVSSVMLFSCARDVLTDESVDLKKARVPIPLRGEVCMAYNNDVPRMPVAGTPLLNPSGEVLIPQLYLSGAAWLTGHATHMGEFIPEQTHMTGIHAELDMIALSQGKIVTVAVYEAILTGDNGDHVNLISHIRIDATDPSVRPITGDWQILSGSGNFENVTGSGVLNSLLS